MSEKVPKEWKMVKLGEMAKRITSGGAPSTKKTEYYGGNIPWLNESPAKSKFFRAGPGERAL
jgi:type I restriction enzyme S subunit